MVWWLEYNTYECYQLVYRASHVTNGYLAPVIWVGTPVFFNLNLNASESMLFNHELKLQFISYVSLRYRIIHVPIFPAQHSAWFFLLSGVTVRCPLQSSLSPESLLSLINFGHFFKQIIRYITNGIWSTDTFLAFISELNDIIVWIYQQNIMCVTWDKAPCTGKPVLNDARFSYFCSLILGPKEWHHSA